MSEALKGLRVVELGVGPVTGIAGMVLADFGAEVLRVESKADHPLQGLAAAPMWQRGKQQLAMDISDAQDRESLQTLLGGADVFISNLRLSTLRACRLDPESLRAEFPHLTCCHISGFGSKGPLADLPGYEHVVAAYAGRMLMFQGLVDRAGPVFSAVQVGVHAAAQSAVTGILAAEFRKHESGQGSVIETSLLQGMLPYEMGSMIGLQFAAEYEVMLPYMMVGPEPPPPSLYYHPAQAGDGTWMQFGNLLPHLFDNFLIATDLIDVLADPAYDAKQMLLTPAENHEAFRARMLSRVQTRSAREWMDAFIADGGIVAAPYQTTQAAMLDPDVVDNGHVIDGPGDTRQIGPLARLSETPAKPGGEITPGDETADTWRDTPRAAASTEKAAAKPLAGIRIVDLATIIAAPIGVSFLADLGAEVIKVEQVGGDPFRGLLAGLGAARVNAGKQSISVNLKTEAGRAVVLRLMADADVVVHNYRPGVPERLGIGFDDVKKINPNVIYLQSNGYGPDGPSALRPSTHPIPGAAMGGVLYQMGHRVPEELQDIDQLRLWTSRLMRANELNPDPNTGLVVASAIMLGLSARNRTGTGQLISLDMFGANAYANADDFIAYANKPSRLMPDAELLGLGATYRLYPCLNDTWVFLALATDAERSQFLAAVGASGSELSLELLAAGSEETVAALSRLFLTREADDWQSALVSAGVACVRADRSTPAEFWTSDQQVTANEFVVGAVHPLHGKYLRHGPLVCVDGDWGELKGPPLAGQHNDAILSAAGYSEEEIAGLAEAGVLWQQTR